MKEVYELGGIIFGELYYNGPGEHVLNIELVEYPEKGGAPCLEFQVNNEMVLRVHIHGALELKSVIDRLVLDYTLGEVLRQGLDEE